MHITYYPTERPVMDEARARAIAEALGGIAWHSGGHIWLVFIRRADGRFVVISDEFVGEYADENAFEYGDCAACIRLA